MRFLACGLVLLCCVETSLAVVLYDDTGDASGYDLTAIEVNPLPAGLAFKLSFSPASTGGNLNWLGGYIDLDTDQNANTGRPSHVEDVGAFMTIGVDYYVELIPMANSALLWGGDESYLGEYSLSKQGSEAFFQIPVSTLNLDVAAVLGNNGTPTDMAPNSEEPYHVSLPEPASLGLLCLGGVLLGSRRLGRKSANYA